MANVEALKSRICELEKCLRAIRDYRPREICYDEFSYKRIVRSYQDAAKASLKKESPLPKKLSSSRARKTRRG